jgi:hypothetical protein
MFSKTWDLVKVKKSMTHITGIGQIFEIKISNNNNTHLKVINKLDTI